MIIDKQRVGQILPQSIKIGQILKQYFDKKIYSSFEPSAIRNRTYKFKIINKIKF